MKVIIYNRFEIFEIIAVRIAYGDDLEIAVRPIEQEINWLDCRFSCPPAFEGQEFRKVGSSSIPSRNFWACDVPTSTVEVEVWNVPASKFDLRDGQFSCRASQVEKINKEITIKSVDFVHRLNRYLLAIALDQARQWISVHEFMEVPEANKTIWYEFMNILDGNEFLVLGEYFTTRGNTTLLLHPVSKVLRVPKKYMGLVIGRKGSNIQALRQKYNIDFKLEEVS